MTKRQINLTIDESNIIDYPLPVAALEALNTIKCNNVPTNSPRVKQILSRINLNLEQKMNSENVQKRQKLIQMDKKFDLDSIEAIPFDESYIEPTT